MYLRRAPLQSARGSWTSEGSGAEEQVPFFSKSECTTLGMKTREGVDTDPTKSTRWPTGPFTNQSRTQKFLCLASYYRRFVHNFASIAKPLYRLTEKTATFEWTIECQAAFAELRHKLCTAPVLAFPDFTKPFILDTNASNTGIGGVLSQLDEQGQEHAIAFASRTLSKSECRYCIADREFLAVVVFTQVSVLPTGSRVYSGNRPWLSGMDTVIQGTRGAVGQVVRETSGIPLSDHTSPQEETHQCGCHVMAPL